MVQMTLNWKRNFYMIWAGQAVSLITSAVLQMAIIFYLTEKTGSAMVLSLATLVGFLPQAVLGPLIGVFVDRSSRKKVMIGSDLCIAAAGLVLAAVAFMMELPVWVVLLILFIRSLGTAFYSPALHAATPLIVPEEELVRCGGYSQAVQSVSFIFSPAAAAFLYATWDMNWIILLDVLGAVVSTLMVAMVPIPQIQSVHEAHNDFKQELIEGYEVLKKHRGLFALLWVGTLFMLVYMPLNALFPLMCTVHFGGSSIHISIVEISFAVGMLIGGLVLGAWKGFQKYKVASLILSILLLGGSVLASGLLPDTGFWLFLVFCGLMGLCGSLYGGIQTALFQQKIQAEYLGRVFSLLTSIMSLSMPLGLLCSALFADKIGVAGWFFFSGVLIIAVAILAFALPAIRTLDDRETFAS